MKTFPLNDRIIHEYYTTSLLKNYLILYRQYLEYLQLTLKGLVCFRLDILLPTPGIKLESPPKPVKVYSVLTGQMMSENIYLKKMIKSILYPIRGGATGVNKK